MTKVHASTNSYGHARWSMNRRFFPAIMYFGALAQRHGRNFGASSAYALLGPDLDAPGGIHRNLPSALGPGWDTPFVPAVPPGGGPAVAPGPVTHFLDDAAATWVRGHLINGEWGGPGGRWDNLAMFTSVANSNHKTVEVDLRKYMHAFYTFDTTGYRLYWYAIRYYITTSTDPQADLTTDGPGNLYSFAPYMARVAWRVVRVLKPINVDGLPGADQVTKVHNWLLANTGAGSAHVVAATDAQITADFGAGMTGIAYPNDVLRNTPGNVAGLGGTLYPLPPGVPAPGAANCRLDGHVTIMQD